LQAARWEKYPYVKPDPVPSAKSKIMVDQRERLSAKFRQMGIKKPYYRIIRPFFSEEGRSVYGYHMKWEKDFPADPRYANDRQELWRAYMLIEKDLLRLFEYIEPGVS
jgi:hypothetical protein